MNRLGAVHSVLTCGSRPDASFAEMAAGQVPPRTFGGKVRSGLELGVDFACCGRCEGGCRLHVAGMDFKGRVV